MHVLDLFAAAMALVAPHSCPGCDGPSDRLRAGFCPACAPLLEPAPAALRPPAGVAAPYAYGGPLADAIRRYKYAGRHDLAAPLGALLAQVAGDYAGRVDRVVPMPMHPRARQERGYDHVALLCRPLARRLRARVDRSALQRQRRGSPQAGLSAAGRLANVLGAFVAGPVAPGARLLLVDDVRTSGATLAEAALTLRRAAPGVEIHCLALATVV